MIQDRARTQPDAPAICAWDGQFTYAELDALSTSFAAHLIRHGVGPEVYVPIYSEKSRWVPVAVLAILKAGGAFALLDPVHPIARLQEMCRTLGATKVVASTRNAELASQLAPEIFLTGASDSGQATPLAVGVEPSNVAYVVFTSGSSGRPKAVAIEHRSFCSGAVPHAAAIHMNSESRVLQFASYAFDACIIEIVTSLIVGACICIPSEEGRTGNLAGEARRLQPNWAVLTPSVARIIDVADFSMLRTLVLAGEAMDEADVRKWAPHLSLFVAYGPCEASVCNLVRPCSVDDVDHTNLGFTVGVRCFLVDPNDHDRLAAPGTVGELLLDGPAVGREYVGDPARSAAAFIGPPRWYRRLKPDALTKEARLYKTGDLCGYNPDGSFRYVGRKDHQKKFHGQRLEVAEVEHNVRNLLHDARHVVVDVVKVDESETLVAFVLSQSQSDIRHDRGGAFWLLEPSEDFRAQARLVQEQLQVVVPQWMIPSVFLPLSYMPLMPGSKSDRTKLHSLATTMTRQQLQSYAANRIATVKLAPSTALETILQQLWADVLRIPASDIGLDDDFNELGGTSIHAMKLAGAARRQGLKLSIGNVFRHGTLVDMAASLEAAPIDAVAPIQPFSLIPTTEDPDVLLSRAVQTCQLQDGRNVEDMYPCTPLQEGLVSLTPRNPNAYTVAFEYELSADIDVRRFQSAWHAVMDANPILRTRFVRSTSGAMYQVVVRARLLWESEADVQSASREPSTWGDWRLGQPLSRFCLRQADSCRGGYHFIFLIHHAISEGWAIPLLLQQVQVAYDKGIPLPPRPFNGFIDYVSRARPNHEGFWTRYFEDLEAAAFPSIPFATYIPRPTGKRTFTIPIESPGINEFSAPNRLKLAWSLLISLYTGSIDTMFGLTVAGRGAPVFGIEDMTGPTIATIPCRLRLELDGTVADALRKIQEDSIAMMPFEQVGLQHISRISPEAALARAAFQSLLVIQPQPFDPPELFRKSRHLASWGDFSTYAITLICQQGASSIEIDATFDPNVVDETQFGRMLQQMRHIFQQLNLSQSALTLRELDTTSPEDSAQLTAWNGTLPEPVHACAHDLIRTQSELRPSSPAVCAWDGSFTYGEMETLSSSLAAYLMDQGVGPEVFVPLCFEKSRWTTIAMLAVIKAGGAFILLDPSHPVEYLQGVCRDARAPFVLSSKRNRRLASKLASRSVVIDTDWKLTDSRTLSSVPNPTVSPTNSIYAVFTAGSTGAPKGVTHSHSSWCTSAQANCAGLYLDSTSRVFQSAAYSFYLSIADNLLTLVAGGCICVPNNEDLQGDNLVDAIDDLEANWACMTPSVAAGINPEKVPTLKMLGFCGEPIPNEVLSLWCPHAHLLNVYGLAECAILTTLHRDVHDYSDHNNIGFPTSAACWVVDMENEQRLAPIGTVGQLVVESSIVATGYINDPGRTGEFFIPSDKSSWLTKFRPQGSSRLYRTGDLVKYTADGSLRFVSRSDTQLKLRGQRIELAEVEYHLRQCFPEARRAVAEVIARKGSSALTAFILPKPQIFKMSDERFQSLAAEATAKLERILPAYMVPAIFIPIDQLPYSESGKLDRTLLRTLAAELCPDEHTKDGKNVMAISDEERLLQDLLARALNIPAGDLGTTDNFVRLGCDSIVVMNLVSMGKDRGVVFSAADVFQNPTIASLAKKIQKYTKSVDDRIQPFSLLKTGPDRDQIEKDAMDQCRVHRDQIEDIYPCTPLQEGLISLSAKTSGMYIGRFHYVIPRGTDLARYQNAWNQVLHANSILRTRIIQSSDNSGFQVVLRDLPPWITYATIDELELYSECQFMTLGSPLLYLSLAPSADGTYHFLLTIHHSLYDGRSFQLLREQVIQAYNGQELSPPPFNRFIRHLAQLEGSKQYWKSKMSDLNAAQFPALAHVDYIPNPTQFLSHSVTGLPNSKRAYTLATMVQLAWAVVLSHYTDSDDVVFGLTFDGRSTDLDAIADIPGPTIATAPIRVLLDSKQRVDESLLQLQQQTVAMIPFLQYGLHNIRKIDENTAKACAFQTQLVVQPPSFKSSINFGELAIAEQEQDLNYERFASYAFVMLCHLQEGSNDLMISVHYDSLVFQEQEARRMVEQFDMVLHQLFERQSDSIRNIEVVSKEDMAQLAIWNGQIPSGTQETLHDLVLQHCRRRPDAEAVSSWDGLLTYRQLDDFSAQLAQHILTFGVQPESKIAVCLEKSCWSIVALLAVLRSGCVSVIVDPGHPRRRIEQIFERATPELIVVSGTYEELVKDLVGSVVSISSAFIESLPSLTTKLPAIAPSQAAVILFTSGSTGTPKGIIMEHINLSTSIAQAGAKMNFTSESRCLHFASYAFDASIYEVFNTYVISVFFSCLSHRKAPGNKLCFVGGFFPFT
jgi:amino acid adenylation domain-containing protein